MEYIIRDIKIALDELTEDNEYEILKAYAATKISISSKDITSLRVVKESVDARRRDRVNLTYSVVVKLDMNESRTKSIKNLFPVPKYEHYHPITPSNTDRATNELNRPVIVGSGPAGLFAGLVLAEQGLKPIIIERGKAIEERVDSVNHFWNSSVLDTETNVQFGEGGAGTFSDGKLTTRINDPKCKWVLEKFHQFGAGTDILYKAKPHIGTDKLRSVIVNMRRYIEEKGGTVRFSSKLTGFKVNADGTKSIDINNGEILECKDIILAIGHSARDTFKLLYDVGLKMHSKAFSIGVRIEHPQEMINKRQFGKYATHFKLGAAEYQIFHKLEQRTLYSFCMCPGGMVVSAASEENTVVTNGMSEFLRNRENANSALVVSVKPEDFGSNHPLAGLEFQRRYENLAFKIAGGSYSAPVQKLGDFIVGRRSTSFGSVKPDFKGQIEFADINGCLPEFVTSTIKSGIGDLNKKLNGFGMSDAVLTGVETRTSSPVRILRDDSFNAIGFQGIYPSGEGAGYAGGIMSAAVDGIKVAQALLINNGYIDNVL